MIGKSYIFHLFLFLLILPDSIYSQDNICLIPQVESMVRKKVRYPSNVWKASISRTNGKYRKPPCQRSERTGKFVCHGECLKSFHSCKKVKMQEPEMYMLEITKQGIIIEAGDQTGMIHAFPLFYN